jgi:hypothetical protein
MRSFQRVAVYLMLSAVVGCGAAAEPRELTDEQREAVMSAFRMDGRVPPESIELVGNCVVAEFLLTDEHRRELQNPVREYAERRLIMIREALLPFGFTDYRVNVNGPPPGTGLIKRYGSARLMGNGSVEWLTGK